MNMLRFDAALAVLMWAMFGWLMFGLAWAQPQWAHVPVVAVACGSLVLLDHLLRLAAEWDAWDAGDKS